MKRLLFVLFVAFIFLPFTVKADDNVIDIYLFHSNECPHCRDEVKYLTQLDEENEDIIVHYYELSDQSNTDLKNKVQEVLGKSMYIPYTVIGNKYKIGFNSSTKVEIENIIDAYRNNEYIDVVSGIIDGSITKDNYDEFIKGKDIKIADAKKIPIPILGEIDPKNVSIPVVAAVIGLVDGFNPCAMWVLIFLVTMLFNMNDRKKMWIFGITFIVTSGVVYLLFMLAWLKIFVNIPMSLIGLFAIGAALFNLYRYVKELRAKDEGCEIVDDKKRKKIINRIKGFTTAKSFWIAIIGVILLALSVNVIELACSAGLPLVFTQILGLNDLSVIQIAINMLIYILFFLLDDLIVFIIAMTTLKITGITTKYTKWSHLIGGIIMLAIGILLIFKPEWIKLSF